LSKAAAVQYAPEKIRVNSIHPELIHSRWFEKALPNQQELQPVIDLAPMKPGAKPQEVAWCLASNEASYVTGAELAVDGGYSAAWPTAALDDALSARSPAASLVDDRHGCCGVRNW
jgi:NAD(P)-dependent dehydrogenase (short-subunit alcohol dehydrogenase family)